MEIPAASARQVRCSGAAVALILLGPNVAALAVPGVLPRQLAVTLSGISFLACNVCDALSVPGSA